MRVAKVLIVLVVLLSAGSAWAGGPFSIKMPVTRTGIDPQATTVIGSPQHHVTKKGEDLLDVARNYDLGWTEIGAMYRSWDPFLPPPDVNMLIPTMWIVPTGHSAQIIVNTGEMRLFYFVNNGTQVYTYPIGMGVLDFRTPTGNFFVNQKKVNPDWHIPKQLQKKYEMAVMPAGPDNPMGAYKLGLNWGDYGIHGCNLPWAVGRLVSHGCTRLYPEDIKKLFAMVPMGTKVEYIYEPALIGFRQGHVYLSVHDDVYFKIRSMILHVLGMLEQRGLADQVDLQKVMQTVEEQNGMPVDITKRDAGAGRASSSLR
ncbi:MAG: L,D-transpeptidase family protein [Syntrophobacterales bacterium]|jgi:L,D-transpeptidase ErfK/SrfK|nr:L,D-transpeptidase family protein [Syntrophobacterales bacterium]